MVQMTIDIEKGVGAMVISMVISNKELVFSHLQVVICHAHFWSFAACGMVI